MGAQNMGEHYSKEEILYLGAYIIYLTASILSIAKIITLFPFAGLLAYLKLMAAGIVFLKVIMDEYYKRNQILLFLFLTILAIYSGIQAGTFTLFCALCFIFGARDIPFQIILKISMVLQLMIMAVTAVAIAGGLIQNEPVGEFVWQETVVESGNKLRYNLGYFHPNTIAGIVLFFTFMFICYRKKCTFITFVICMAINYCIYQWTGSRTSFLMSLICLPLMLWFTHKKRIQIIWKILLILAPLILSMMAVILSISYDPEVQWMAHINTMLSGRLGLGQAAFETYGFLPFGQKIVWITNFKDAYNYVDSSYMRLLLDFGYIVFIVVIIACMCTMYFLLKQDNREYSIAFLALLVYAMIEPTIFSIENQPFYLLIGMAPWMKKGDKNIKDDLLGTLSQKIKRKESDKRCYETKNI